MASGDHLEGRGLKLATTQLLSFGKIVELLEMQRNNRRSYALDLYSHWLSVQFRNRRIFTQMLGGLRVRAKSRGRVGFLPVWCSTKGVRVRGLSGR